MLLVPRQLLRSGMTGSVPYYGGRFTPAQAWAAAHPTAPPMGSPTAARLSPVFVVHYRQPKPTLRRMTKPPRRRRCDNCTNPGC